MTRALLEHASTSGDSLIALSLHQLVHEVSIGASWHWSGGTIDPSRTAVVNRLAAPSAAASPVPFASTAHERRFWLWWRDELARFAYASSLPSSTSLIGCHGSLLDQWQDLPERIPALRVPAHRGPWSDAPLAGDVHAIDPWQLYSLGSRVATNGTDAPRLRYARPGGHLVHVAQVGGMVLFADVPPAMTRDDQAAMVSFAGSLAGWSEVRILEHAFFVGDGPPVFYSTCPYPVVTGNLPEYPALLLRGLDDDIDRRRTAVRP